MQRDLERVRFLRGLVVATALAVAFAAWVGGGLGGDTSVRYVDDLATAAAALAATVLCVRAGGRQGGRSRLFWWLLAGAAGAWALGELIWAVYDLGPGGDVPALSWADAAYLAAIPPAAAALLVHPAVRGRATGKARSVLDGLVLAAALFFVSWTLVLGPVRDMVDLSTLGGLVTLAYPVGDVVLVFLVVLVLRGTSRGDRLDLWCLLAGLLAITLSHSMYGYLTQVKGHESGSLIDTGWFAGYLAIAVGAFCSCSEASVDETSESRPLTPVAAVAPFLPMLTALTLAAVQIQRGRHLDRVAWNTAFVLAELVLVRQALLVTELLRPVGRRSRAWAIDSSPRSTEQAPATAPGREQLPLGQGRLEAGEHAAAGSPASGELPERARGAHRRRPLARSDRDRVLRPPAARPQRPLAGAGRWPGRVRARACAFAGIDVRYRRRACGSLREPPTAFAETGPARLVVGDARSAAGASRAPCSAVSSSR